MSEKKNKCGLTFVPTQRLQPKNNKEEMWPLWLFRSTPQDMARCITADSSVDIYELRRLDFAVSPLGAICVAMLRSVDVEAHHRAYQSGLLDGEVLHTLTQGAHKLEIAARPGCAPNAR